MENNEFQLQIKFRGQIIHQSIQKDFDFDIILKISLQTKTLPYYRNKRVYLLLTSQNYRLWVIKSYQNLKIRHKQAPQGFKFQVYLKMKKQCSQKIEKQIQPPPDLSQSMSFSFSESRIPDFMNLLNLN